MTVQIDSGALRQLRGLTGESGSDLLGELIDVFGATTRDTAAALDGSVARGESAEARRLAHTLAGASTTVGAVGIAALAREVEALAQGQRLGDAAPLVGRIVELLEPTLDRLRAERNAILAEP